MTWKIGNGMDYDVPMGVVPKEVTFSMVVTVKCIVVFVQKPHVCEGKLGPPAVHLVCL